MRTLKDPAGAINRTTPIDVFERCDTDIVLYDYADPAIEDGTLYATIEAELVVERDGLYDFSPTTADTARLWIDNDLIQAIGNIRLEVTASLAQASLKRESRFHSKLIGHTDLVCCWQRRYFAPESR
jgi:hypothetical protein